MEWLGKTGQLPAESFSPSSTPHKPHAENWLPQSRFTTGQKICFSSLEGCPLPNIKPTAIEQHLAYSLMLGFTASRYLPLPSLRPPLGEGSQPLECQKPRFLPRFQELAKHGTSILGFDEPHGATHSFQIEQPRHLFSRGLRTAVGRFKLAKGVGPLALWFFATWLPEEPRVRQFSLAPWRDRPFPLFSGMILTESGATHRHLGTLPLC
jgi:hypothetical protein